MYCFYFSLHKLFVFMLCVFTLSLFSKWNYHWSIVANGDKMAGEESEFRRLTSRTDEAEQKPKIRFKIVPPPPKPKLELLPPAPPPPRRSTSPRHHRPKRKVEVDVFRLCWRESWRSLKPPKYLYLKARESKGGTPRLTRIEPSDNKKYEPALRESGAEWTRLTDKWSQSWKQVRLKCMSHMFKYSSMTQHICCRNSFSECELEPFFPSRT